MTKGDLCKSTVQKKDRYQELYNTFHWKVPDHYNFGFDVVDQWAEDRTKLALISIDRTKERARYHTFYDLKVRSNQFANNLRKIGVKKGERVLVILQSIPEWYEALIGMFKVGVVPMPGTVLLTAKDIEYRINRAEASMVLTDLDHADIVEMVKEKCPTLKHLMLVDCKRKGWKNYDAEMEKASRELTQKEVGKTHATDPMLIYFTSGTTGHPKMVLHTHSYPLGHEVTARFAQALTKCDLHWAISETGWAKAAWGKRSERFVRLLTKDKIFAKLMVGVTGGRISISKYKRILLYRYLCVLFKDVFSRK